MKKAYGKKIKIQKINLKDELFKCFKKNTKLLKILYKSVIMRDETEEAFVKIFERHGFNKGTEEEIWLERKS